MEYNADILTTLLDSFFVCVREDDCPWKKMNGTLSMDRVRDKSYKIIISGLFKQFCVNRVVRIYSIQFDFLRVPFVFHHEVFGNKITINTFFLNFLSRFCVAYGRVIIH